MADLKVSVAGVEFHNPLIAASGTFGFGREYAEFYPLSALGGISSKGITLKARPSRLRSLASMIELPALKMWKLCDAPLMMATSGFTA